MNQTLKRLLSLIWIALFFVIACEKREYQSVEELDEQNIQAYISKNNLSVEEFKNTGIYFQVLDQGSGAPLEYDIKYPIVSTVQSLDRVFTSQDTFSVAFPVQNRFYDRLGYFSPIATQVDIREGAGVNSLLKEHLQYANSKIRVIIPSRLAFGTEGNRDPEIPSNASLDCIIYVIDPADFEAYEDATIASYASEQGLSIETFTKTESGIYYKVLESGTTPNVLPGGQVQVNYKLKLFNGELYESRDSVEFNLENVISGWQEVLPMLNEKSKARILIPSLQAYGMEAGYNQTTGAMIRPPFTPLDYEVTILDANLEDNEEE